MSKVNTLKDLYIEVGKMKNKADKDFNAKFQTEVEKSANFGRSDSLDDVLRMIEEKDG